MHMFSRDQRRNKRKAELEKRYPEGTKILIEVEVLGVGVGDPFPTDFITCRGLKSDFLVSPEQARDLQQVIEAFTQATDRAEEATRDMHKVRDELEEQIRNGWPYNEED